MSRRFRARPGLALLAVLLALCPALQAQRLGSITGTVHVSQNGPLIEGARVQLIGTTLSVVTNRRGEFAFHGLVPGKYVIQASAIGYTTLSSQIEVKALQTLEVEFETDPQTVRLPDVAAVEPPNLPADFVRRKESGRGRYFSRADIEHRNANSMGDLLRTVPGLQIDCRSYPCRVTLVRASRNCPLAYFIDGAPTNEGTAMLQIPRDLDGVEIYSGPSETPPELERYSTCGALALWTRSPPPRIKKEKPPKPAPAPPPKPDTVRAGSPGFSSRG